MKQVLLDFFVVLLSGCTMPSHVTHAQSQDVHIRIDGQFNPERCEYKGEVTGSEGHWYNYIFMTNDAMMQGAMSDLKKQYCGHWRGHSIHGFSARFHHLI